MLGAIGGNEFDELIAQPLKTTGPVPGDMAIISSNLLEFPIEGEDLSNFTFGDDGYDDEIVGVQQETTGKESIGMFNFFPFMTYLEERQVNDQKRKMKLASVHIIRRLTFYISCFQFNLLYATLMFCYSLILTRRTLDP